MSFGMGNIQFVNLVKQTASGAPFAEGSAHNGTSLDSDGKVVLGNDTDANEATLENNREIPLAGHILRFTGAGSVRTGRNINSGARVQNEGSLSTKRLVLFCEAEKGVDATQAVSGLNDNFAIWAPFDTVR